MLNDGENVDDNDIFYKLTINFFFFLDVTQYEIAVSRQQIYILSFSKKKKVSTFTFLLEE